MSKQDSKEKLESSKPKMLSREKIIEKFQKSNFHCAQILKEDEKAKDGQNIQHFFVFRNVDGEIEEIEVTNSEKEHLVNGTGEGKVLDEIRQKVGKSYPFDEFNPFRTYANKFTFYAKMLRYDNKLVNDVDVMIKSHNHKNFDQSFFLEEGGQSHDSSGKIQMPIVKGRMGKSIQKKLINENTKEMKDKVAIEAKIKNEEQTKIEAEYEKNKDFEKYKKNLEDCLQKFERKKIEIRGDLYKETISIVGSEADYVCGKLKLRPNGQHELVDWFNISKPFRCFITMLKYPEIFKKGCERQRSLKSSDHCFTPMNQEKEKGKRFENFEMDLKDVMSGSQKVISNTWRKYDLLKKDFEIKKDDFWYRWYPEDLEKCILSANLEKFDDVHRNLRFEQFSIDHCHTVVVLMIYIIFGEFIFRANGVPLRQILYADTCIHASWDIPNWLREAVTDKEDLSKGVTVSDWSEE
jgi:hypothetical protein